MLEIIKKNKSLVSIIPLEAASKCHAKLNSFNREAIIFEKEIYTTSKCAELKTARTIALIINEKTGDEHNSFIKQHKAINAAPYRIIKSKPVKTCPPSIDPKRFIKRIEGKSKITKIVKIIKLAK